MFDQQLSWRAYLARPELTLAIPMQSPFRQSAFVPASNLNHYADWVRRLRGGTSGVYWYGWQYDDDELPVFYIGCSAGYLYSTFVRHFSGVYSPVNGVLVPRSIVPSVRHYSVYAGVITTTQEGALILESRMIASWMRSGICLENRNTNGYYDFSGFDPASFGLDDIVQAKRYLRYLETLYGVESKRSGLYQRITKRMRELDFVPF